MEIAVRAVCIFFFLWAITRAVGRSTLGELSTFELLLYVTMGDLVQQAVTQQDSSVTGGVIAISVFALLTVVLSWVQWRFPRTQALVNGVPIVVMRDSGSNAPCVSNACPTRTSWRGAAAGHPDSQRRGTGRARGRRSDLLLHPRRVASSGAPETGA